MVTGHWSSGLSRCVIQEILSRRPYEVALWTYCHLGGRRQGAVATQNHSLKDFYGEFLKYDDPVEDGLVVVLTVLERLHVQCKYPLDFARVFGRGQEVLGMFTILYNVDRAQERLSVEEEERILNTLKQALGVQNQQPMWRWDVEYDFGCVAAFVSAQSADD